LQASAEETGLLWQISWKSERSNDKSNEASSAKEPAPLNLHGLIAVALFFFADVAFGSHLPVRSVLIFNIG
jgi:hypothetical protein